MDYANSVWRCRHRVAGFNLWPLTLGHCLLLQKLGSPLVPTFRPAHQPCPRTDTGEQKLLLGDVLQACYVCSHDWRKGSKGINGWIALASIRARANLYFSVADAVIEEFIGWWTAQWDHPNLIVDSGNTGERGADAVAMLVACERLAYSKTFELALDTLVSEAFWDFALYNEEAGRCKIAAHNEVNLAKNAERFERRMAETGTVIPSRIDSAGVDGVISALRKGLN